MRTIVTLLLHRIHSSPKKRVTFQQTADRKLVSRRHSVPADCSPLILRAGRLRRAAGPRSLSDIDPSTTANDPRPSASFSAQKNPQRIPANTPPVFPGLRPRIWPHLLGLVTNGNVGQAPMARLTVAENNNGITFDSDWICFVTAKKLQ